MPRFSPGASQSQSGKAMYSGMNTSPFAPHASTLLVAIIAEILLYGMLRYVFRTAHGG